MRAASHASFATVRRLIRRDTFKYLSSLTLLRVHLIPQRLAGLEYRDGRRSDRDLLAGARVVARARSALPGLKRAEAAHLQLVAGCEHVSHGGEHSIDRLFRIFFGKAGFFRDKRDEFAF